MTKDELIPILEKHKRWLHNEYGGEKANLYKADLHEADLHEADLRGVNLYEANLCGADLSGANLFGTDLREADLHEANLRGVDLREANLYGANTMDLISAGPIGSRHGITIYNIAANEIQCGCFRENLEGFGKRVELAHADNPVHLAEYRAAIAFFGAVKAARGVQSGNES